MPLTSAYWPVPVARVVRSLLIVMLLQLERSLVPQIQTPRSLEIHRCAGKVRLLARRPASGRNHSLDRRQVPTLERCGGVGHVPGGHARNRRVEVIERLARQRCSDLGTKSGAQWGLMNDNAAAGLRDRADNRLDVEWNQGSQVDDCR